MLTMSNNAKQSITRGAFHSFIWCYNPVRYKCSVCFSCLPVSCRCVGEKNNRYALRCCYSVATCTIPDTSTLKYKPKLEPSTGPINYGSTINATCTDHLPEPVVIQHKCVYDKESKLYEFVYGDSLECPGRCPGVTL